jgi:hypothetical protein
VRIAVRDPLANLEHSDVWYCYRDGKLVQTPDGLGAARLWSPTERELRRSLDLIEQSSELLRRSHASLMLALRPRGKTVVPR